MALIKDGQRCEQRLAGCGQFVNLVWWNAYVVATELVMMVRIPLPKIDACIDTIIDGFLAQNLCIVSFCIVQM